MDDLLLISKDFVDNNEILKEVEQIAKQLGLTFFNDNNPKYIATQFETPINEFESHYFRFMMDGIGRFNQTKADKNVLEGYGILGYFYYDSDDLNFLIFLKALLNKYPTILAYNEWGNASPTNPFVFSYKQLEAIHTPYDINQPPSKNI